MFCPFSLVFKYKHVRGISSQHIGWFKHLLGKDYAIGIDDDPDLLHRHSTDWIRRWEPIVGEGSPLLLKPGSSDEVANIVKYCHEHRLPLVPQGGNTGMVGGSTPTSSNEIIVSLSRMNRILNLDPDEGIIECEAGCTLAELSDAISRHGYDMPLDLGAKGTCQIGGNLSTNAGGVRYVKHGPLRSYLLKLEVIDGRGRKLSLGSLMRKDNTGVDMKQLFVGAEGTLGIITAVSLRLPQSPAAQHVALLKLKDFTQAALLAKRAKKMLGESLSALEYMDEAAMRHVMHRFKGKVVSPFDTMDNGCYLLVEAAGANAKHDSEKLMSFLEVSLGSSHEKDNEKKDEETVEEEVLDAVVARSSSQLNNLWQIRELCPSALTGYICYKYDLSLPISKFEEIMIRTRHRLVTHGFEDIFSDAELVCWGHLGDGNIHLNVISSELSPFLEKCLEPWLFEWVIENGGSISAEHGVGRCKRELMSQVHSSQVLETMITLKQVYDPRGILNPNKMFPSSK